MIIKYLIYFSIIWNPFLCFKYNVVFLIIDDMRPLLANWGYYHVNCPNINRFAEKSIVFTNAFAQQSLCAPSRNSLLTSRRPDSLRLYDFFNYWRDSVGNFTTIPQYFKEHGYDTYSVGKVFHPGVSSNYTDDYPYSWTYKPYHPSTDRYENEAVCRDKNSGRLARNLVCPVIIKFQPEKTLPDIQSLQRGISFINSRKNNNSKPFFLAVGFKKPHIPFKIPQEYIDQYLLENITLAKYPFRPYEMPTAAWNPGADIRKRDDIKKLNILFPFGIMPTLWAKKIRQSYYASLSYIDSLVGKLLFNLDKKSTIIFLTSDHGWSLGENGLWAKYTNFDVGLKVPLIIHIPNSKHITIKEPVELLDIFPTLVDLSGLSPKLKDCNKKNKKLCTDGKSLMPLIKKIKPSRNNEKAQISFSQYPRPTVYPTEHSDKPKLKEIKIMGYTLRTNRFRYTEWIGFDGIYLKQNWSQVYGQELYDHLIDEEESTNLVHREAFNNLKNLLSKKLRKKFSM